MVSWNNIKKDHHSRPSLRGYHAQVFSLFPYSCGTCSRVKPGEYVLSLLKEAPNTEKTILFLRHSKRNSFAGIPDHLRPGVEITPEGRLMAKEFGTSLGQVFPGRRLLLAHTTALRCRMTAECILQGYSPGTRVPMIEYPEKIGDPVRNYPAFIDLRETLGWQVLIRKWLDGEISPEVIEDPVAYSRTLLHTLLSSQGTGNGDLFVAIVHDITLFPIISRVFRKKMTSIDFLNGIVISSLRSTAEIRFSDADCSLKRVVGAEWTSEV